MLRCEIHILLSKGIIMLEIIGTIVDGIGTFFTDAIALVTGSIN